MAAGVEDGVEVLGLDAVEAKCSRELRFCLCIGFEPVRKVGLKAWFVAFRIERWLAAFRRGKHDISAGFLERVVGGGELFEPETRFTAGVAELVVRGQNHQNLHKLLLLYGATFIECPRGYAIELVADGRSHSPECLVFGLVDVPPNKGLHIGGTIDSRQTGIKDEPGYPRGGMNFDI